MDGNFESFLMETAVVRHGFTICGNSFKGFLGESTKKTELYQVWHETC